MFGPNGEVVPTSSETTNEREAYFGQYQFITGVIPNVIQEILDKSSSDPVIILQSDHGPRWSGDWNNVLNAYHLPGNGNSLVYDDISPVNSFRIVFDKYLGANYPLIEDR